MIVVLVHGTFAVAAPWIESSSFFRQQLVSAFQEPITFIEFKWSGRNSHSARAMAGRDLAHLMRKLRDQYPASRLVLVGHSHGGNVALYARKHDTDANCEIITLNTPFIHVASRDLDAVFDLALSAFSSLLFVVSFISLLLAWGAIETNTVGPPFLLMCEELGLGCASWKPIPAAEYGGIGIAVVFLGVLTVGFCGYVFLLGGEEYLSRVIQLRFRIPERQEVATEELSPSLPRDGRLLALNILGDEAELVLSFVDALGELPLAGIDLLLGVVEFGGHLKRAFLPYQQVVRFLPAILQIPYVILIGVTFLIPVLAAILLVPFATLVGLRRLGHWDEKLSTSWIVQIWTSMDPMLHRRKGVENREVFLPSNRDIVRKLYLRRSGLRRLIAKRALAHSSLYGDPEVLRDISLWLHGSLPQEAFALNPNAYNYLSLSEHRARIR